MFAHIPNYDYDRTLELLTPRLKGEDVFALQIALDECSFECGMPDGVLGPVTSEAMVDFQTDAELVVDGKAGGKTQRSLAMRIARGVVMLEKVPLEAVEGQIEWESAGFRLGAYSPIRPDGTYDAGITQRNTAETPAKEGFDPALSIRALAKRMRSHYLLFEGVRPNHRRWVLAQMSWNGPAFACYIAKEEGAVKVKQSQTLRPSSESRLKIEAYGRHVSKYLPTTI